MSDAVSEEEQKEHLIRPRGNVAGAENRRIDKCNIQALSSGWRLATHTKEESFRQQIQ